jgi:dTDP-4-dehydrorhamnose reductase
MVTGAGGMLADAVALRFAGEGDAPFGIFFSDADAAAARGRFPRGAVVELGRGAASREALARAADEAKPEWLLHLAAWTDVDGCERDTERARRSNADACGEAASVAAARGARLLAISTDYVFDGRSSRPYAEADATAPLSEYGRSKLAGEALVRAAGGEHVIVRSAWLFGPNGRNFVDTIRARLEQGQPVKVVGDQRGCPTYTPDLARALRTLVAGGARGTYHVTNAGEASWYELAREIGHVLGREELVTPTTTEALGRPAPRPRYSVLDGSKYAAFAGAPLPDWRDALRRHLAEPTRN